MKSIALAFLVGIRTAFIEMGHNKLRSFLSMLGVLLGVAALVAMLSLIGGIQSFLSANMSRWIGSMWIWTNKQPEDDQKVAWSRSPGLKLSDGAYARTDTHHVATVYDAIERRSTVSVLGEHYWRMKIRGCSQETFDDDSKVVIRSFGQWMSEEDFLKGNKVCVISWDFYDAIVSNRLRNDRDTTAIIGADMVFKGVRFKIIGVMGLRDTAVKPFQLSWSAILPLLAMQRNITGFDPDPSNINIMVKKPEQLQDMAVGLMRVLSGNHRGAEDFEYRGADWVESMTSMLDNISLVMGIISVVSLLVGGLGIMNVMLSSISERIKEIGIRKALGAQNLQIFIQFIAETTTLSMVGGIFGAGVGLLPLFFAEAIKQGTQGAIVPTIMPIHGLFVVIVIISVGVLFGMYPAIKASRMNPIDALRYE